MSAHPAEIKRIVVIYSLSDETGAVRYVGKTNNTKRRLREHHLNKKKERKRPLGFWLEKLSEKGLRPVFTVLEEADEETWRDAERRWIAHFREAGAVLLNCTDGGEDGPRCPKRVYEGFVDPSGQKIEPVIGLCAFCEKEGLAPSRMWLVYHGKCRAHHGWTSCRPEALAQLAQTPLKRKPKRKRKPRIVSRKSAAAQKAEAYVDAWLEKAAECLAFQRDPEYYARFGNRAKPEKRQYSEKTMAAWKKNGERLAALQRERAIERAAREAAP